MVGYCGPASKSIFSLDSPRRLRAEIKKPRADILPPPLYLLDLTRLSKLSNPPISVYFLRRVEFPYTAHPTRTQNHVYMQYCLLRFIFLWRNFHLLSQAVSSRLIVAIIPADK